MSPAFTQMYLKVIKPTVYSKILQNTIRIQVISRKSLGVHRGPFGWDPQPSNTTFPNLWFPR